MCGISYLELTNKNCANIADDFVRQSKKYLARRGPDGHGLKEDVTKNKLVKMIHYRLAVQDLSDRSLQPMTSDNGAISIVYNGEIYNFLELRSELIKRHKIKFETTSDTEVLLRGYEHHGIDFLKTLEGMYAFVIYDDRKNQVVIGRDHAGMKPLYFSNIDGQLLVASDVRVISKTLSSKFSDKGTAQYFSLGYCLAPETIFQDINQVRPGEVIIFKDTKRLATHNVFDLAKEFSIKRKKGKFETFCSNTRSRICETMNLHMRADVSVGLMASGGVDTRVLALGLNDLQSQNSLEFGWTVKKPDNDWEDEAAAAICEGLNAKHKIVNAPDGADIREAAIQSLTHPCVDMAVIYSWILGRCAREENCPVLLTGVGGDELFFGYNRYQSLIRQKSFSGLGIMSKMPKTPKTLEFLRYLSPSFGLATSVLGSFGVVELLFGRRGSYRLLADEFYELDRELGIIEGYVHRMLALDLLTYVPNQLCTISDSALMDNSIEGRIPLLSKSMIRAVSEAAPEHLYRGRALKGGVIDLLTEEGRMEGYQGKSGFGDNRLNQNKVNEKQKLLLQMDENDSINAFNFSYEQLSKLSYFDLLKLNFLNIWLAS